MRSTCNRLSSNVGRSNTLKRQLYEECLTFGIAAWWTAFGLFQYGQCLALDAGTKPHSYILVLGVHILYRLVEALLPSSWATSTSSSAVDRKLRIKLLQHKMCITPTLVSVSVSVTNLFSAQASSLKNAIGCATWEWSANCPCDGGSSMSSSETWNTEVCCTVVYI